MLLSKYQFFSQDRKELNFVNATMEVLRTEGCSSNPIQEVKIHRKCSALSTIWNGTGNAIISLVQ